MSAWDGEASVTHVFTEPGVYTLKVSQWACGATLFATGTKVSIATGDPVYSEDPTNTGSLAGFGSLRS